MTTGTIEIYGIIGTGEGEISHQDVVEELEELGAVDELVIRINSKGGDVWEALGIYSTLNQYKARKIVFIDGIALSCASWIACVGDEINIAENGMYMYHEGRANPGQVTANELIKTAETVKQLNGQMAETYAARTGIPVAEIAEGMAKTTWLRAKEAVAKKFATKLIPNKAVVARCDLATFNNVPDWVQNELTDIVEHEPMAAPEPTPTPVAVPDVQNTTATPVEPLVTAVASAQPPTVVNVHNHSATQATPAVPSVVDVDELKAETRKAERKRMADIFAICNLAGASELALDYIKNETEVADVQAAMYARVCAERKPVGGNVANVTNSGDVPAVSNQDAADIANYEANKEFIAGMGVSRDAYLQQLKAARKK